MSQMVYGLEYYIRHISLIDFQYSWTGVSMIHAVLSFITMIFLFTLATMIIRARPDSSENRFMALMLFVEGLKTFVAWYSIYPFGPEILPLVQYWRAVYYTLAFLSILMYLSLSSFYPVKFLKFMTHEEIKKNLYWALPLDCSNSNVGNYSIFRRPIRDIQWVTARELSGGGRASHRDSIIWC